MKYEIKFDDYANDLEFSINGENFDLIVFIHEAIKDAIEEFNILDDLDDDEEDKEIEEV